MTLMKRLRAGGLLLVCTAALAGPLAGPATAAPLKALSSTDAQHYAAAFDATDRGDFIDAQMRAIEVQDKSLLGYLSFSELMHPTAHRAAFEELAGWLAKFRELPVADRVFALASRRKPADTDVNLPTPAFTAPPEMTPASVSAPDRGRAAREAYYAGDPRRALTLAQGSGERWIAGLAAWRMKSYDQSRTAFEALAADAAVDPWLRSAGAFWASRAAAAMGDTVAAAANLTLAAQAPQTFYGMIAQRQLHLQPSPQAYLAPNPGFSLVQAAYNPAEAGLAGFVQADPRAHRAVALVQIGRVQEAGQELRAGLLCAATEQDRQRWAALATALAPQIAAMPVRGIAPRTSDADYPTPDLAPKAGFTIDKALVYAMVRQESRFNPLAMSPAGAVGLMQLMPEAAARAAGDDKLKADMSPLFDPAFNLRVGQDYVTWLMERGVGYDILRTVAAYNGGPGMMQKTVQAVGADADTLLIIESLPAQETRNYVEKVMAAYWTYRRMWGQDVRTLDAVANGASFIDARLDLADPRDGRPQFPAQALQVGMR